MSIQARACDATNSGGRTPGSKLLASPPPLPRPDGGGNPWPCTCVHGPSSSRHAMNCSCGDIRSFLRFKTPCPVVTTTGISPLPKNCTCTRITKMVMSPHRYTSHCLLRHLSFNLTWEKKKLSAQISSMLLNQPFSMQTQPNVFSTNGHTQTHNRMISTVRIETSTTTRHRDTYTPAAGQPIDEMMLEIIDEEFSSYRLHTVPNRIVSTTRREKTTNTRHRDANTPAAHGPAESGLCRRRVRSHDKRSGNDGVTIQRDCEQHHGGLRNGAVNTNAPLCFPLELGATYPTACIKWPTKHSAEYGDNHEEEKKSARCVITTKTTAHESFWSERGGRSQNSSPNTTSM